MWFSSCIPPVNSEVCIHMWCLWVYFFTCHLWSAHVCVFTEQKSNSPGSQKTASPPSFRTSSCRSPGSLLPLSPSRALSLSLWDGLVRLWLSGVFLRWPRIAWVSSPRRGALSASGPQLLPLLCCFAGVAWVASLLCVNSALIQKLFYAVKRTCDRRRGVEGGEERRRREGRQGNTF